MTEDSEQLGRKQTAETRRKISKAMTGDNNPAYDKGQRSYREKVHAKPGQIVHHKDGSRANNDRSNLEIIPKSERRKHESKHERWKNFTSSGGRKPVTTTSSAKRLKK